MALNIFTLTFYGWSFFCYWHYQSDAVVELLVSDTLLFHAAADKTHDVKIRQGSGLVHKGFSHTLTLQDQLESDSLIAKIEREYKTVDAHVISLEGICFIHLQTTSICVATERPLIGYWMLAFKGFTLEPYRALEISLRCHKALWELLRSLGGPLERVNSVLLSALLKTSKFARSQYRVLIKFEGFTLQSVLSGAIKPEKESDTQRKFHEAAIKVNISPVKRTNTTSYSQDQGIWGNLYHTMANYAGMC
ncbi:hypothetical protein CERSUDRAFT_74646 [Gelatoporia subvermispora B]|uniref:Uncharacterized protein n=1 Tax=Ceriporiopsis subvermispora (strain B) TaxID=914234 RepID=M2RBN2_CERS8|nr:hypothetical protein CERSUDRAFT_74646 [Gelatoporia subvermispora B]